jgi:two-component system sensor histidine kinase/response regulator
LIDDNAFNRQIGLSLLETMGHRIDAVADIFSSVRFCKSNEYELVLIDIQRLDTDGGQTMKPIREMQERQEQCRPVIALTGPTSILDRDQALAADTDESLAKPLSEKKVRREIHDAVLSRYDPTTGTPNPWSLAPDVIRATFPMSESAMKLVVTLFQESCVERLERIRIAFQRQEIVEIARNLHALKGSISMFASIRTVELLSNLELEVKQGHWLQAEPLLSRLENAIECLQPTLDQLLQDF